MLNTYESGGVVVTGCLGVTVSLEYRVSLHNLVLKGTLKQKIDTANSCMSPVFNTYLS